MKDISILIPTYNDPCLKLVEDLQRQAAALPISYEIIVADDGSTDQQVVVTNRAIGNIDNCRFVERGVNSGRAAIRNFLASEARYDHLLFIDSDMVVCRTDFLHRYAQSTGDVAYGGVIIGNTVKGNLRSMYEKAHEHEHTVERRQSSPYQDFHTANFLIRRDIMLAHPFDSRFRHYGYEDVLFGKELELHHTTIVHIDNSLSFEIFESNADFVSKTEEGLRTLYTFRDELQDHSHLLAITRRLSALVPLIRFAHRMCGPLERRLLTGRHPSLLVFNLYRMGYFLSLSAQAER